jgi:hypothetical protein
MMLMPVASASPNGDVRVSRPFRLIPETDLENLEEIEETHRELLYASIESSEDIRRTPPAVSAPASSAQGIGFRRAARTANAAGLRRDNRTDAERRRASRARR